MQLVLFRDAFGDQVQLSLVKQVHVIVGNAELLWVVVVIDPGVVAAVEDDRKSVEIDIPGSRGAFHDADQGVEQLLL